MRAREETCSFYKRVVGGLPIHGYWSFEIMVDGSFLEKFFKGLKKKTRREAVRIVDALVEDPAVGRVDPLKGNLHPGQHIPGRHPLPCPMPIPSLGQDPWNVIHVRKSIRATLSSEDDGSSLKVVYVGGKVGAASGVGFHAAPRHMFPTLHARVSYKVYFPEDFDWVKGGKLPGLFIGNPGASGGHWDYKAGSARVTWQRDGIACVYIYIPLQVAFNGSKEEAMCVQSDEFQKVCHATKSKGCHLWHSGPLQFQRGQWNDVTLDMRMNTVGKKNGSLELIVNGVSAVCHGMVWRKTAHLAIGGVSVQTFYGGSTPEAAAPKTGSHYVKFKDFMV